MAVFSNQKACYNGYQWKALFLSFHLMPNMPKHMEGDGDRQYTDFTHVLSTFMKNCHIEISLWQSEYIIGKAENNIA